MVQRDRQLLTEHNAGLTALHRSISEREFSQMILDTARLCGWLVYHTWSSEHSEAGFPDLCLIYDGELWFWEIKTMDGRLTPRQVAWLRALRACHGVSYRLVRPDMRAEVTKALQTRDIAVIPIDWEVERHERDEGA